MSKKIRNFVFAFLTGVAIAVTCSLAYCQTDALERGFANPPEEQRVGCYWYWIDKKITKEGIIADLHAMKKAGITRAYIGLTGGGDELKFMSPEWWDVLHTAFKTATELNIELGSFNCPGWSQSGGPWIKPNQSMRYLAKVEKTITGPKKISEKFDANNKNFENVKVLTFPVNKDTNENLFRSQDATTWSTGGSPMQNLYPKLIEKETTLILHLPTEKPAQGLTIFIGENQKLRCDVELQALVSDKFETVKKFSIDRSDSPNISRGFNPWGPVAVSFPEVKSKEFKVIFRNGNNQHISNISLTHAPVVDRYVEKTMGKMFNSYAPPWNAFMWDYGTADTSLSIKPEDVKDITNFLDKDGTLTWDVPAGEWVILRLGMVPTGATNSPSPKGGSGLECDKLSAKWTEYHYDSFMGEIFKKIPAEDRKTFKVNVLDSYEKGGQNFTDDFIEIFKNRYGYDPTPYLPAYYGYPIGSPELSSRFLWDMRRLVADKIAYDYIKPMREKSHKDGLTIWLENYGSWGFAGEFLQYGGQSDEVGGEFWHTGNNIGEPEIRCATSCAHTYGKPKVWAEALTSGGGHYTYYPGNMKRRADWSFAEGVNAFILHVYIQQQADNIYPGIDAWYNIQFNRKNTWFSQMDLFTDYIRRCGFMLQQGLDVADVAYYIGEDAPKMQGVTNPPCPKGYHYDFINAEVLLKAKATPEKNGLCSLTLPHGTKYRVLVLPPQEEMRPNVLEKVLYFAGIGVPVVGTAPKRSPSLQDYPKQDEKVQQLSEQLAKLLLPQTHNLSTLLALGPVDLPPDFVASSPVLQYSHRKDGDTDIYFVTNQSGDRVQALPVFRVFGKQPELWNPVTGQHRLLPAFTQFEKNKTTSVPLQLEPDESVFIVFRKTHVKETTTTTSETVVRPPSIVVIEKAVYGKLDEAATTVDATEAVKKIVAGGTKDFAVNDITEAVGDPKFGFVKTLRITYKVDGQLREVSAKDGGNILLQPYAIADLDKNFPEHKIVSEINSAWTVTFESDEIKRGPSEPVIFER
ncbi:MAG: hypothetical protein LBC02_07780, partial [Planctomycetaceae bacterium]|nr:hypothetical protein [Planctomycetaceae bacterium]